jgi:predicted nucleic-acid-binding protein
VLAIDTNVLVRFLTGDDPVQSPRARALIHSEDILILTTVLLETEWVLRSGYKYEQVELSDAFRTVIGLPRVHLQDPEAVTLALEWMRSDMDFADALHLATAKGCTAFATFDRSLARQAEPMTGLPARLL